MYKIRKTYVDYDGNERSEDFYFNLTAAEITEMQYSVKGGLQKMVQNVIDAKDEPKIIAIFKDLVLKSFGVKSDDGRRFIKNDELREEFSQTPAYSMIFMELATDDKKAAEFVNNIIPADIKENKSGNIQVVSNTPAN